MSNSTSGPAAAAAPTDPTPAGPPPQSTDQPPDDERGGRLPPSYRRTPPAPPAPNGSVDGAGAGPAKPSPVSEFVNRLFGRRPSHDEQPDQDRVPEQPDDAPGSDAKGATGPPLSTQAQAIAAQLAALPADELDRLSKQDGNPFARAVQSEIDRRIARANKERDAAGRQARQQRVQGLKQQARQLRQTDVYKAAELEEQVDALEQQEAFVRGVVENYDRVSIDPLMLALPEGDRAALMADLPDGLDGRRQLVTAALARLEQVWRADERRKLTGRGGAPAARNGTPPAAGMNALLRGDATGEIQPSPNPPPRRPRPARPVDEDEDDEPELTVGGRGRRAQPTMNDWLRSQMQ
jgi:hypothetical protein